MSVAGRCAWVTGGGEALGKAIALELAARGAKVVVSGPDERALGLVVGEIAYGGGKTRHAVVAPDDARATEAALAKLRDVFGAPSILVLGEGDETRAAAHVLATALEGPDAVVVSAAALPGELRAALAARGVAHRTISVDRDPEIVARELAVALAA